MLFLFLEICRFFLKDSFSLEKCKAALLDSGIKKNTKKRPKELIKIGLSSIKHKKSVSALFQMLEFIFPLVPAAKTMALGRFET